MSTGDDDPSNDFQKSSESSESEDSLSELELKVVISSSGSSPSIPSPANMNYGEIKKTTRCICVRVHVLPRMKEVDCKAKNYRLGREKKFKSKLVFPTTTAFRFDIMSVCSYLATFPSLESLFTDYWL